METPVVSGNPRTSADKLMAANAGLIGAVLARKFAGRTAAQLEELEAAARLALWQAACRFDPARGVAFSTFATRTILGSLLNHLRRERSQALVPTISLSSPLGEEGGELADLLPNERDCFAELLDAAAFEARIACCSPRQQALLRSLYGEPGTTLEDAGDAVGLTRSGVWSVRAQALRRLRVSVSSAE